MFKLAFHLMRYNGRNNMGIFICIGICVIILVTSLTYINYSMIELENEIDSKYGDIDAVVYCPDHGDQTILKQILHKPDIQEYAGSYSVVGQVYQGKANLYAIDINRYNLLNQIMSIDNKELSDMHTEGVYITGITASRLGRSKGDGISVTFAGKMCFLPIIDIIDEKSIYELGSRDSINIYMSVETYRSIWGVFPDNNIYYLDLAGENSSRLAGKLATEFGGLTVVNVVEEKDLKTKSSSSSFIYAVSFIIMGLIAVVCGGIYNFCRIILNDNLTQIGYLRTLGVSNRKSILLFQIGIVQLGLIGFIVGMACGFVTSNLFILLEYNNAGLTFPDLETVLLALVVAIGLPYVIMSIGISRYAGMSPVQLLLSYRQNNCNENDEMISKHAFIAILMAVLYSTKYVIMARLDGKTALIANIIYLIILIKTLEGGSVCILELISRIGKRICIKRNKANNLIWMTNITRNKRQVKSILGTVILIITFHIGMYGVFYSIRTDAVQKVENQFNGDVFIHDFNLTAELLKSKIDSLKSMEGVVSIEQSSKQYMQIEGNKIVAYFLTPDDFKIFFNYKSSVNPGNVHVSLSDNRKDVIIGESLAIKGGIKIGDQLEMADTKSTYSFTVKDICDSNEYMGNVVYINKQYYNVPVNTLAIKLTDGSSPEIVSKIAERFGNGMLIQPSIATKDEVKENFRRNAIKGTSFIESILIFISTAAIFILINQISVFMQKRKREFIVLKCLGGSDKMIGRNIFIEAIVIAIVGISLSTVGGVLAIPEFVDVAMFTSGMGRVWDYACDFNAIAYIVTYVLVLYLMTLVLVTKSFQTGSFMDSLNPE